jgi:hypothetical protein
MAKPLLRPRAQIKDRSDLQIRPIPCRKLRAILENAARRDVDHMEIMNVPAAFPSQVHNDAIELTP